MPNSVESRDGNDVVTTLDIDLQDVATTALLNQLRKHDAHHGCAVLMEVATGDIKAIANLGMQEVTEIIMKHTIMQWEKALNPVRHLSFLLSWQQLKTG